MGISQKDQIESFGFCEDIKLFPVRFETEKLPFPVVGMSDVMPYQSTRYQDMTDEMLKQWKSAFQKQIDKAINEFQPDSTRNERRECESRIATILDRLSSTRTSSRVESNL